MLSALEMTAAEKTPGVGDGTLNGARALSFSIVKALGVAQGRTAAAECFPLPPRLVFLCTMRAVVELGLAASPSF